MRRSSRLDSGFVWGGAAALAGYLLVRRWHTRWGATAADIARPMPGDERIPQPTFVTDRAVVIRARPDQIWPWLAQMGEGRGGFYSYDWIDNLLGIRVHSADGLLPGFHDLKQGDVIPAGRSGFAVLFVERDRCLVLGPEQPMPSGNVTWAIGLYPLSDGGTRVVSRVRTLYQPSLRSLVTMALLDPGQFLMERKFLLGLRNRVESASHRQMATQAEMALPPLRSPESQRPT